MTFQQALCKSITITAMSLSILGCATSDTEAEDKTVPSAETPSIVLLTGACPVQRAYTEKSEDGGATLLFTLGSLILSPIIEAGSNYVVDSVTDYLKERQNALNASSTAKRPYNAFYQYKDSSFSPNFGCLIFMRGGLGTHNVENGTPLPSGKTAIGLAVSEKTPPPIKIPEIYAEFHIQYEALTIEQRLPLFNANGSIAVDDAGNNLTTTNKTTMVRSFGIRPVYLIYNQSGAKRNTEDWKQLVATITIKDRSTPPSKKDAKPEPRDYKTIIDFGKIMHGITLEPKDLAHKQADMQAVPIPSLLPIPSGNDANGKPLFAKIPDSVPITVTVNFTETEDGGDFERMLAEGLDKKRGDISKTLVDAFQNLIPKPEAE